MAEPECGRNVSKAFKNWSTQELVSGIDNTSSNISTIPITILYTSKIYFFLNHNTGTILVYNTGTNLYFHFKYFIDKSIGLDNRLCLCKSSPTTI